MKTRCNTRKKNQDVRNPSLTALQVVVHHGALPLLVERGHDVGVPAFAVMDPDLPAAPSLPLAMADATLPRLEVHRSTNTLTLPHPRTIYAVKYPAIRTLERKLRTGHPQIRRFEL